MPNKHRGEVEIQLGSQKLTLRPTFEALAETEAMTSRSLTTLATDLALNSARATDWVALIYCGVRAANPRTEITFNEIGGLIMEEGGLLQMKDLLADYFAELIRFYSPDDPKSDEPDEKKVTAKKTRKT